MQCQEPPAPFYGLWSRLERFEPAELVGLLESRAVLRTTLMRATLHLTSAEDFLAWRPMHQSMLEKRFAGSRVREAARRARHRRGRRGRAGGSSPSTPGTTATLGRALAERWPDHDKTALAYAVRFIVPLAQLPPRGTSLRAPGRPGRRRPRATLLGRPLDEETAPDALLLRYLAAFGPASVADMRMWSGLPGLAAVWTRSARGCARSRRARPRAARPAGRADRHGRGARAAALPAVVRQHPARPRRPLARAAPTATGSGCGRQRVRARRRLRACDVADRARRRGRDPAIVPLEPLELGDESSRRASGCSPSPRRRRSSPGGFERAP